MRVLIADDNADSSDWLAVLLQCWGYDPVAVHDGPAALAVLQGPQAPALAVLDWIMPGINGIEICRAIRKDADRPYTYVVLVTGKGGKEQMLAGMEAGADDYLVKPVDPAELHARLSTGKRIVLLQEQLLATQRQLREQATRDGLTGLWSVVMADLDHFKQINDTYGHLTGDQVIRQTAQCLRTVLRSYDTVGRYGGEEFLVVLPGCDAAAALVLAERLRGSVEAAPVIEKGTTIPMTLSLGMAGWERGVPASDLLRRADAALYRAKNAGRNRVLGPLTDY
jgi:diguanylate cyclase (GGDEF)-like protein